jgi:hypothetical protein
MVGLVVLVLAFGPRGPSENCHPFETTSFFEVHYVLDSSFFFSFCLSSRSLVSHCQLIL